MPPSGNPFRDSVRVLGLYIRAQIIISVIDTVLYATGFAIAHVPWWPLFALIGGVCSLIPSVGSLIPLVLVGLTGGRKASLDLGLVLTRRLEIIGTVMRARPLEEKIEVAQLLAHRLVPLVEQGRLRPVIDRVMPLRDAAEAHRHVASNDSLGKVVLQVG